MKSKLDQLFQLPEKNLIFNAGLNIDENAEVILCIPHALMYPGSAHCRRFESVSSKTFSKLFADPEMILLVYRSSVIKPGGQDYFVTSERDHPGLATQAIRNGKSSREAIRVQVLEQ
jgi:hypothetical protein